MNNIQKPIITQRITNNDLYKKAIDAKTTKLQALIIANRDLPSGTDINGFMNPSLDHIPNIGLLSDIQKAGSRIADAIINKEVIALACDFDVDGISSSAVLYKAIVDLFNVSPHLLNVCISNRMTEGYGFSSKVIKRLTELNPMPTLVITADQGSANSAEVSLYIKETKKELKKTNSNISKIADVIISDHHEIPPSGGPVDAYAFVNPQQKIDKFPDKTICGCTVAMFLMAATRSALIKKGYLDKNSSSIKPLMAYSTAATISDCVSMASELNRAIVQQGLSEMEKETLPAWSVMKDHFISHGEPFTAEKIAFGLGPMINACSRTGGDGLNAVRYYLSETKEEAERYFSFLEVDNKKRKDIEKRLVLEAKEKAIDLINQGYSSLVIPLKNGHHGIHGIAASRLVETFGYPTIILSPKETSKEPITKDQAEQLTGIRFNLAKLEDFYDIPKSYCFVSHAIEGTGAKRKVVFYKETILTMSGSGRSIDGLGADQKGQLNLLKCMIEVQEEANVFIGFGGHHMAAGMALNVENIIPLRKGIDKIIKNTINESELYPKIWTDGALPDGYEINDQLLSEISSLEPYGRQFDYPTFSINGQITNITLLGADKETAKFELLINGKTFTGIWFKYPLQEISKHLKIGDFCSFVVEPKYNYFNKSRTIQLQIKFAELLD